MSNRRIILKFNSEVKGLLERNSISLHDGISYLLCLHYGTEPSFMPEGLERKVLATGIVSKDYVSNTIKWNHPLFEETEVGFEWIKEWMDLFKGVNPDRRGTKSFVLKRMKKFFVNNPTVRKEEVINATKAYFSTVNNSKYCKKSHKFIYEADGSSMLFDFVEAERGKVEHKNKYKSDII